MEHKVISVGFFEEEQDNLIKLLDDDWEIVTATYVGDFLLKAGGLVQYVLRKEVPK